MKLKRTWIFILLTLCVTLIFSCKYGSGNIFYEYNSVDNRVNSLKKLTPAEMSGVSGPAWQPFSFMILSDIHFGSIRADGNPLPLNEFWAWMDSKQASSSLPDFIFILGDNIDWCDDGFMAEYEAFCNKIENEYHLKIFNILGNHDMYQMGWEMWSTNCFPHTSFYKFEVNGFSFYALDTGSGTFGKKQVSLLKEEFAHDSNPKVVLTHYPLYTNFFYVTMDDTTERNLMINLFNQNDVKAFFNGHIHRNEEIDLGSFTEYSVPSLRFRQKWTIVTVDPATSSVNVQYFGK